MFYNRNFDIKWGAKNFERVFDMLGFIQQFLEKKFLPQYFLRSMNILYDFNEDLIKNMLKMIKRYRYDKNFFLNALL